MLEIVGFDPQQWELKFCKFKLWNVFRKKQQGGHDISELFSASVMVSPLSQAIDASYIDELAKGWRSREQFPEHIHKQIRRNSEGDNILEINLFNLHLGKLCWQGDTDNNYDTKIAQQIFYGLIDDIMDRVISPISKIYFVWSNDFYNSDTINKATPTGTMRDTDIRWQKLFNIGCAMLIEAIIRLVNHFKVPLETIYLESNHDTIACYYTIKVLEARFYAEPYVIVNTSALPRKIIRHGNNIYMIPVDHYRIKE